MTTTVSSRVARRVYGSVEAGRSLVSVFLALCAVLSLWQACMASRLFQKCAKNARSLEYALTRDTLVQDFPRENFIRASLGRVLTRAKTHA